VEGDDLDVVHAGSVDVNLYGVHGLRTFMGAGKKAVQIVHENHYSPLMVDIRI